MAVDKKIALVTGGSRGLGKDMAISIARKGIDVILTYRSNNEEAEKVVKDIEAIGQNALALHLNMSEFNSLNGFVSTLLSALSSEWKTNSIDFLINNAGMGATVPFTEVTEELFTEFLNVHFKRSEDTRLNSSHGYISYAVFCL